LFSLFSVFYVNILFSKKKIAARLVSTSLNNQAGKKEKKNKEEKNKV